MMRERANDVEPQLVSVIIPCHNAERFLPETLESVARQTYKPLEIVLIDDGSTDRTRSLIESLGPGVKAAYTQNKGAAEARNLGMGMARGEYLQFLDADDLLAPTAIEQRVGALQSSGASVAYSDWQRLVERKGSGTFESGETVARRIEDVHADREVALFTNFWSPPAALLYTRDAVSKIGGWKQHLAPIEDARFLLDAALTGARFAHVAGIGALYRMFDAPSHSRRDPQRFVLAVLANAIEIEALWRSACASLAPARRHALADCYGYVARSLFRSDPENFDIAVKRLSALQGGQVLKWPRIAGALQRTIGHRAALWVLAALRRPAP
jgi:glycosyltransferase involved in cell wall biosynthesis